MGEILLVERTWMISMVSYNNLLNDYNSKIDDLSPKEAEKLIQSLVRKYYDAYDVDDMDEINRLNEEIDRTIGMLKRSGFNNLEGFLNNTFLYYSSSLLELRLKKQKLHTAFKEIETYISHLSDLEFKMYMLHSLLNVYFFTHGENNITNVWDYLDMEHDISNVVGDDVFHELHEKYGINPVFMKQMDGIIQRMREGILETHKIIEERFYSPDDSQEKLDFNISKVRNMIHEIVKDDFYSYQRDKGLIDVLMCWIRVMKLEHELNMRYKELKNEFAKLMRGNNGFSSIVNFFYEDFGNNYPSYSEFEKTYPRYNIGKSTFVPPESKKGEKLFDSYFRLKDRNREDDI